MDKTQIAINRRLVDDFPVEEYLPPRADVEDQSYYSQVFPIKFMDSTIKINEQVFFRIDLDSRTALEAQSVFIEAKLLWQNQNTKRKDKY